MIMNDWVTIAIVELKEKCANYCLTGFSNIVHKLLL